MAVSKRTRYEVLRRDNHTCRYCGGTAPDVTLTVDHVIPVSLGGSDDPSNLVAACKDCNAGKSSSNPDAPLVADVSQDAVRWAAAMKAAAAAAVAETNKQNDYIRCFYKHWTLYDEKLHLIGDNWEATVTRWYAAGMPIELVTDAIDVAMSASYIHSGSVFRYMCGVVWKRLTQIQEDAQAHVETLAQEPI